MSKVLITGGNGMLATDLASVFALSGYEVIALGHERLDVTRHADVERVIAEIRPNVVAHTVGTLVDPCELDPELGYRVQVWATGAVARSCERIGATLVNFSTCGVFGDERRFYSEYDPVVLKTEYSRSKVLAEEEATRHCSRTYNIRPGWLYGGSATHKKNFVAQRYREALDKGRLASAVDKYGSPTNTGELARKLLEILDTEAYGLYHLTNTGGGSRYEYVREIVLAFDLDVPVDEVDSSHFSRPAAVPDCEMLRNLNVEFLGLAPMSDWKSAIHEYVRGIKAELVV